MGTDANGKEVKVDYNGVRGTVMSYKWNTRKWVVLPDAARSRMRTGVVDHVHGLVSVAAENLRPLLYNMDRA